MAVSKAKKVEQLATLEVHLKEAKSVAFTSNQKITVLEVSNLKKDLRAQNAIFLTAKKTLIRIAFKNVYNAELDLATLPGQVAVIIAKGDALSPLGVANKYATEWKKEEKLTFVGGYMDGRLMDATETKKLATLPSREVLLAKLLGSMMSPLSSLARFFDAAKKDLEGKSLAKVGDLTAQAEKTEKVEKVEKTEATPEKKEEAPVAEAPKAEEATPAETPAEPTPEVVATEEKKEEAPAV